MNDIMEWFKAQHRKLHKECADDHKYIDAVRDGKFQGMYAAECQLGDWLKAGDLIRADDTEGLRAALAAHEGMGPMGRATAVLSDEVTERLRAQAEMLGLDLNEYVGRVLREVSEQATVVSEQAIVVEQPEDLPEGWAGIVAYRHDSGRVAWSEPKLCAWMSANTKAGGLDGQRHGSIAAETPPDVALPAMLAFIDDTAEPLPHREDGWSRGWPEDAVNLGYAMAWVGADEVWHSRKTSPPASPRVEHLDLPAATTKYEDAMAAIAAYHLRGIGGAS